MNNMKAWALLAICFIGFIAIIATAYSLIPDGVASNIQNFDNIS
ncbi:hypothetical protein [Paenibacillus sp. GCM10028914]